MMMSDGSLSQAEIDALLQSSGTSEVAADPDPALNIPPPPSATTPTAAPLSSAPAPTAASIDITTVADAAKQTLSTEEEIIKGLLNTKCHLKLLTTRPFDLSDLQNDIGPQAVQITHVISGGEDKIIYLLSEQDAIRFASFTIGQEDLTMNDLVLNALQEVFSQFYEPLLEHVSQWRGEAVDITNTSIQRVATDTIAVAVAAPAVNSYQLSIKREKITFYEIFDIALSAAAAASAAPPSMASAESAPAPAAAPQFAPNPPSAPIPPASSAFDGGLSMSNTPSPPEVRPIALTDFGAPPPEGVHHASLELLMDVDMQLTVELGQTRRQVREILQLGEGSIIELDKLAGEPVDVKVNQRLIAKGEVVVIDENFGVRITEIISPADRIKNVG